MEDFAGEVEKILSLDAGLNVAQFTTLMRINLERMKKEKEKGKEKEMKERKENEMEEEEMVVKYRVRRIAEVFKEELKRGFSLTSEDLPILTLLNKLINLASS